VPSLRRVLSLLFGLSLALVPVWAGAQTVAPSVAGRYVSLGDSFSSGEGLPPFELGTDVRGVNQCHRSFKAYPALVAGQAGVPARAASERWSCSGATILHLVTGEWNEPPQLGRLDGPTTLVTLTTGGNDIGFAPVFLYCLLHVSCQVQKAGAVAAATDRVSTLLPKLYASIARRAPNARVLVVGYPRLLPQDPGGTCAPGFGTLDAGEQRWINAATLKLDYVIAAAVSAQRNPRLRFVNTYEAFAGRELCGGGGALYPVIVSHPVYSFHPTILGQTLLANRVLVAARAA